MKNIAIVCAMLKEYDLLTREFGDGADVHCLLSGIGKVNAAVAAERLIARYSPDCILSIGVAGSFAEGVSEGETVIVDRTAYHDVWCGVHYLPGQVENMPLFYPSDPELIAIAKSSLPDAHVGLLCTGDQFYISPEEDARQKGLFPDALAVDMEGAAVAQVAYMHSTPFLAVKIISDTHNDGRQKEHYDDFWDRLSERSFSSIHKLLDNLL